VTTFTSKRRPRAIARVIVGTGLLLALLPACATRAAPRPSARPLPADSAALLAAAIERARPAFPTQGEALAAGVYRESGAPVLAAAPPARATPAPAAPSTATAAATGGATAPAAAPPSPHHAPPPPAPADVHPERTAAITMPTPELADRSESGPGPLEVPRYVVQVAAYRDPGSAALARDEAARRLPDLPARVEEQGGMHRVVVGGWTEEGAAERRLAEIREAYPTAWVRALALP
jgi:hypothetical protein